MNLNPPPCVRRRASSIVSASTPLWTAHKSTVVLSQRSGGTRQNRRRRDERERGEKNWIINIISRPDDVTAAYVRACPARVEPHIPYGMILLLLVCNKVGTYASKVCSLHASWRRSLYIFVSDVLETVEIPATARPGQVSAGRRRAWATLVFPRRAASTEDNAPLG